jgi:hypothetical protein
MAGIAAPEQRMSARKTYVENLRAAARSAAAAASRFCSNP